MTNRQWMELIAKEFGVSNSKAKSMLSAMYRAYGILKVNNMELNEHDEQEIKNLIAYREAYKDWIKLPKEERTKGWMESFKKNT